jgi:trehalose 6-phosphate phosphatase
MWLPPSGNIPRALDSMGEIRLAIGAREVAFFLDFDGTLAPIVARPELAQIPEAVRAILGRLSGRTLVCFLSGRGLTDLRTRVGIESAFYAANHGRQIVGPPGSGVAVQVGVEYLGELSAAAAELERRLLSVPGVLVEAKGLSVSVHYRLAALEDRPFVKRSVAEVAREFPSLTSTSGKMVLELRPPGPWNKGAAMLWLLERLGLTSQDVCPLCLGDDLTDEDMFVAAKGWGVNLVVGRPARQTHADYLLEDGGESAFFLNTFVSGD